MKSSSPAPRARTRRAILDALADVIIEADGVGFSVQAVADRAGVTHRTVYNHFPTREALCDAFSDYVDERLLAAGHQPDDEVTLTLASFPGMVEALYGTLAPQDRYVRAYVMLMIGNRRPVTTWRQRTSRFETFVTHEAGAQPPIPPRQATAAIRLFASSLGWHVLTEHCGLSTEEAAATSAWATRTLLDAATAGPRATPSRRPSKTRTSATPRRRG